MAALAPEPGGATTGAGACAEERPAGGVHTRIPDRRAESLTVSKCREGVGSRLPMG